MITGNSKPPSDRIRDLARWSAARLETIAAYLNGFGSSTKKSSEFVDLAPTDEADPDGVYARALGEATTNPNVSNIALTGPYGSGKSSIIRTFLKRHPRSALHISLAAFLPEADDPKRKVSKQEIERSILQQLLYGADADKLPLSRFKRIKSPGFWSSIVCSFCILVGVSALWYLFAKRSSILSGAYFLPLNPTNWLNFTILGVAVVFMWAVTRYLYVSSFSLALKSVSLKSIELSTAAADNSSILNHHLDEIVYFFQSTDYDLVVIEDLDRFDDSDIFVTLREINSLVNGYVGVKRRIQFLYALRDDMFANTDRTKFFEFIIPVIPIINASNAIDMVLKQGERLALQDRLDPQFLREVSRYLNDLRLIRNIFNEYAIYVANLETDGDNSLDPNKLLAVLIYKNTYPRDFEKLHRGEGRLAAIFDRKDTLIAEAERAYRKEIGQLEQEIEIAEQQTPKDIRELRRIYAMALLERLPSPLVTVGARRDAMLSVAQLTEGAAFDEIVTSKLIQANIINHGWGQYDISDLQSSVDPTSSYGDRVASIEMKSQAAKDAAYKRIRELREKIKDVRSSKFNMLLRNDSEYLDKTLSELGDGGELARFLLLEGHLDDTYYQYTSLFHSGRLSPNDNRFLRQIRGYLTPEPDFPLDNVAEVIANMRDEDFGLSYVLNVKLVDVLLSDPAQHDRRAALFRFLSAGFAEQQGFFQAYYSTGAQISKFLVGFSAAWPRFVPALLEVPLRDTHLASLIEHAPARLLSKLSGDHPELGEYLSSALPAILSHAEGLEPSKLNSLAMKVQELPALESYPQIIRALVADGHYRLSLENIDFIYTSVLGRSDIERLHRQHFSCLREIANGPLMARIDSEFETYFENVLCRLDSNNDEVLPALLEILSHDELDAENVEAFIARQNAIFPSLQDVPERYHSALFRRAIIEPNWENCLNFLRSDTFDPDSFLEFLGDDSVRSSLLRTSIPAEPDALRLRNFIREANGLPDDAYRAYVAAIKNKAKSIPGGLEPTKRRIIVEESGVQFTEENLAALSDDIDLQIVFVSKNIRAYLDDPSTVSLDDDFRERLLRANIADGDKRAVIDLMDLNQLVDRPVRAALVGPILARTDTDLEAITPEVAQAIIVAATPTSVQVRLFNELNRVLNVSQVRETLKLLPRPYNEITVGFGRPQLDNSEENRTLVGWLDGRNIISSFGKAWWSDDIVINLYRK